MLADALLKGRNAESGTNKENAHMKTKTIKHFIATLITGLLFAAAVTVSAQEAQKQCEFSPLWREIGENTSKYRLSKKAGKGGVEMHEKDFYNYRAFPDGYIHAVRMIARSAVGRKTLTDFAIETSKLDLEGIDTIIMVSYIPDSSLREPVPLWMGLYSQGVRQASICSDIVPGFNDKD